MAIAVCRVNTSRSSFAYINFPAVNISKKKSGTYVPLDCICIYKLIQLKKTSLVKFFLKSFGGPITDEERTIVSEWEALDPNNSVSDELSPFSYPDTLGDEMLDNIHKEIKRKPSFRSINNSLFVKVAASLFLISTICLVFYYSYQTQYITINVPMRQRVHVKLSDGSDVWLNAGTIFKYPRSFWGTREVYLLNGEAFFDVAHNAKSVFMVHNGKYHARVLGTAFNIRAYEGLKDLRITVARGKVEVGTETESYAVLNPDREIIVDKESSNHLVRKINSQKVSRWKVKEVNLYDVSFKELVETIQNNYDVKIEYPHIAMEGTLTTVHFSTTQSLREVLNIIKMIHQLNYKINGKEVTLEKLTK